MKGEHTVLMPRACVDVAIIGAGPYGLSLAAHLRARGVEHRIFGRPMHAWRSMPPGMYLKSLGFATSINTPQGHPTLPEYCRAQGLEDYDPIAITTFAQYGLAVQQDAVPYLEESNVAHLERRDDQFALTLETGERLTARRVVLAIGLSYFECMPDALAHLPKALASHTAQHGTFAPFAGRRVAVVGGGQSALQAAALLHTAGAQVDLLARRPLVWGSPAARYRPLLQRMRAPGTVIGWGKGKWVLEHVPMLLHYLPAERRLHFNRTKLGPSGAWWLREQVERDVPLSINTSVVAATASDGGVRLSLSERGAGERELVVDHVIAGTGYVIDVDRIGFLDSHLAQQIRRLDKAPRLSRHFESSVRGLYFVGPSSVASFGPLFRFVAGATYTIPQVARHLASRSTAAARVERPAAVRVDATASPATGGGS